MLQSLVARRLQQKEIEKIARKNPRQVLKAFDEAVNHFKNELISRGIMDKYTGEIDFKKLKLALRKDKDFAKRFYTFVGNRSGLKGDKLIVGKVVTKTAIRSYEAAQRVAGAGLTAGVAVQVAKLNELGTHLANRFGKGSFSEFITRYQRDDKFREAVNKYINKVVNTDPKLASLKGYKPEQIVEGIVAVKAATMSRMDILRDAAKPTLKRAVKNYAAHTGVALMSVGTMFVMQASNLALSVNPQLSQTMYMAYYATQQTIYTSKDLLSSLYMRDTARQIQQLQMQNIW